MKSITTISLFAGIFALAIVIAAFNNSNRKSGKKFINEIAGKGFAVVELFTSEGCSSCPPADEVLAKIKREFVNQPVYILAYHVDYWNRLGWKDKFSNPEFSKRQRVYSSLINAQIYTPQVIINGKTEFVGSDEQSIRKAISAAVNTASSTTLKLNAHQNNGQLTLNFQAIGTFARHYFTYALVQKSAISQISNGENNGKTLSHAQIVNQLQIVALPTEGKGTINIKVPNDFSQKTWELIGFIQNTATGEIGAADKIASINYSATQTP
jgi:hypothetical protein